MLNRAQMIQLLKTCDPNKMMNAYNQFSNEYTPQTAEQEVRKLVSSGRMSQPLLNLLQFTAPYFQNMFNIK